MQTLYVRTAQPQDLSAVRRLLDYADRQFVALGHEDLFALLHQGGILLADSPQSSGPAGLVAITHADEPFAYLRAVLVEQSDSATPLVRELVSHWRAQFVSNLAPHLVCYATSNWLVDALLAQGFLEQERVITYKRPLSRTFPSPAPEHDDRLRAAHPNDLEQLVQLDEDSFALLWQLRRSDLQEMLLLSDHFVVAEQSDQLISYVCSTYFGEHGHLARLAVHPAYRQKGWGRHLLNHALAAAQAAGIRQMTLNTQASNTASRKLYEATGFDLTGPPVPVLLLPSELDDDR